MPPVMEVIRVISDGELSKNRYEVSSDVEGLGCVEIRVYDGNKIVQSISFPPAISRLIADALMLCADEIEAKG